MSLLDFFLKSRKENTAKLAKERLQIIVAHERTSRSGPDYLPQLKQDILDVIRKYVQIDFSNFFIAVSIVQAIVLSVFLLLPDNIKRTSNQLPVIILVSIAAEYAELFIYGTGTTIKHPNSGRTHECLVFERYG